MASLSVAEVPVSLKADEPIMIWWNGELRQGFILGTRLASNNVMRIRLFHSDPVITCEAVLVLPDGWSLDDV